MSKDQQGQENDTQDQVVEVMGEDYEVEQARPPDPDAETYELPPDDPFQLPVDVYGQPVGSRPYIALQLRMAGASYQKIAERLGYSTPGRAENALINYLNRRSYDDKEQLRKLEIERLDSLQLICWRLAKEGNLAAIDRILKIMEMRRVYAGIEDTTTVHQQAVFVGGSHEEYVEALKKLRKQAKAS